MKNLCNYLFLGSLFLFMGCSNNSEEPAIDCDQTDLSVSIASLVNPTCSTQGSITVGGSGGTTPYTYSIDGTNFQSTTEFSGLVAGDITVTIMDADGCTANLNTTIQSDGGIAITLSSTNSDCLDATGSIEVAASGGDGAYTYRLDEGSGQTESTFSGVSTGDHEITVTDGSGCNATKSIYVSSNISLSNDIMPLLQAQCTFSGCHNGDNGSDRNWTEKDDVLNKAEGIKSRTQNGSMPRSPGTLTQDQIDMIACWVDDGAQDN
ncbi:SprB repeat-containing protein [Ekhidna lutea]|uniref:SprB repeat-containing protein n=1 Tax=Ekhidna lutea TaxID=447679 RepID=A0A239LJW3_EKHLU|nr:SprB repeat-containing protein [Ekhidna lutea]SNT30590.1 SprB repeat-containing protein [Ekhidna lutea]